MRLVDLNKCSVMSIDSYAACTWSGDGTEAISSRSVIRILLAASMLDDGRVVGCNRVKYDDLLWASSFQMDYTIPIWRSRIIFDVLQDCQTVHILGFSMRRTYSENEIESHSCMFFFSTVQDIRHHCSRNYCDGSITTLFLWLQHISHPLEELRWDAH
jgi:hypothetical protein